MTDIFKDGFDLGDFSAWSETSIKNGSLTVTPTSLKGDYAAKSLTVPTLELARAQAIAFIDEPIVYARAYFYINQGPESLGTHDRFYFLRILGIDAGLLASVGIRREADQPARWTLWYRITTNPYAGAHIYGIPYVETGPRWICIELAYNRALGQYEVWVDGISVVSMTVGASDNPDAGRVEFGIYKSGATGASYDPTGEYTIEVLIDECVIADTYIGLLEDGTVPPTTPPIEPLLPKAREMLSTFAFMEQIYARVDEFRIKRQQGTPLPGIE